MKIFIVGGSIAGSLSALFIKNHDVYVFEEHASSGEPQHCSGLISYDTMAYLSRLIRLDDLIINKIKFAEFNFYNSSSFTIKYEKGAYVVNRKLVDERIALKASKNAKFFYNTKFNFDYLNADIFIGADGPLSKTALFFGFPRINYIYSLKAYVKCKQDPKTVKLFYDSRYFPGFFGWYIPHNEVYGEIGFGSLYPGIFHKSFSFLSSKLNAKRVSPFVSRLIPISNRYPLYKRVGNKSVFLVGDSAGQIKFSSGGGLAYIIKSTKLLAENIDKPEEYQYKCDLLFNKEYFIHNIIRHTFSFSPKLFLSFFVNTANFLNIPKLIGAKGDMDYPSKTIKNILNDF